MGVVRLFHLHRKGNHVLFIKQAFWAAQTCVHFMKVLTVYTLTSHVLTLKKVVCFCCLLKHFEASLTNSVDPDQTGSALFASILMLNNKHPLSNVVVLLAF